MKTMIKSVTAPAPIGPYSQAVLAGNALYMSGQIAIDPESGQLVNGNIAMETRQVMENLKAVLSAAEMDFSQVVKATIFVRDLGQFAEINTAYGAYFGQGYAPARETVEVSRLPGSANVEISMIAIK